MKYLLIIVSISLIFNSCCNNELAECNCPELPYEGLYNMVVQDAMNPEPNEIYKKLNPIIFKENSEFYYEKNGVQYVRVVTWKSEKDAKAYYGKKGDTINTCNYNNWVTIAPDLQNRMKELKIDVNSDSARDMRVRQLLGLSPNFDGDVFVEMWVNIKDVFRPCPDPGIADRMCDCYIPNNVSDYHRKWINTERATRYTNKSNKYTGSPWTQLGYTYDWNLSNKSHVGLSEYIIKKQTHIIIAGKYTNDQYLNKKK